MKFLVKAGAILDHFNNFLFWVAAVLLFIVWFAVCADVFMRYFLNRPIAWAFEISEHILMLVTFLGTAWLLRRDGHVKIDLLVLRFKPRVQVVINSMTSILCAIACLIVAWYGGWVVWDQFQRSLHFVTLLAPPMWPLYLIIPVSGFLLFIQFLRRTYGYLAGWRLLQATNKGGVAKPET